MEHRRNYLKSLFLGSILVGGLFSTGARGGLDDYVEYKKYDPSRSVSRMVSAYTLQEDPSCTSVDGSLLTVSSLFDGELNYRGEFEGLYSKLDLTERPIRLEKDASGNYYMSAIKEIKAAEASSLPSLVHMYLTSAACIQALYTCDTALKNTVNCLQHLKAYTDRSPSSMPGLDDLKQKIAYALGSFGKLRQNKTRISVNFMREANACFKQGSNTLEFGRIITSMGETLAALSENIGGHEATHCALHNSLRGGLNGAKFHADLVHEFMGDVGQMAGTLADPISRTQVITAAQKDLDNAMALRQIAEQFGRDLGCAGGALRDASNVSCFPGAKPLGSSPEVKEIQSWEAHDASLVLTGTVYHILKTMYNTAMQQPERAQHASEILQVHSRNLSTLVYAAVLGAAFPAHGTYDIYSPNIAHWMIEFARNGLVPGMEEYVDVIRHEFERRFIIPSPTLPTAANGVSYPAGMHLGAQHMIKAEGIADDTEGEAVAAADTGQELRDRLEETEKALQASFRRERTLENMVREIRRGNEPAHSLLSSGRDAASGGAPAGDARLNLGSLVLPRLEQLEEVV